MIWFPLALLGGLCAADEALVQAMPMRVTGPWTIETGPGEIVDGRASYVLDRPAQITLAPPELVRVTNERYARLPLFNEKAGGWRRGAALLELRAQECTATGLLRPDTVCVKPAPDGAPFEAGKDYAFDAFWATVGRLDGGAIAPDQPVCIDYAYRPCRLDSVAVDAAGTVRLIPGLPHVGAAEPVEPGPGEVIVGTVWIPGDAEELTSEHLYPIDFGLTPLAPPPAAEQLLPRTLATLRAGKPVTIVAWGDSVTNGGGVTPESQWYQHQFHRRLAERFPEADITLHTAAWPGGNSRGWLQAPPGGEYDFQRDVLDKHPDLVTIEFVNDAYLDEAGVARHYGKMLERFEAIGAEVILITPHYVRPDWMRVNTQKLSADPRPYVKGLRVFAATRGVALADASRAWGRLWRQGIPYTTLLLNGINHPDHRGHALFADALMALFPAS